MLDSHRNHVQKDEYKNGNFKSAKKMGIFEKFMATFFLRKIQLPSGQGDVIKESVYFIGRPSDDLLWLFSAEFFHGSVIILLAFSQKHLQNATFVLFLKRIEIVDDDTNEQIEREKTSADDENNKVEIIVF